jgi:hypothetical protein
LIILKNISEFPEMCFAFCFKKYLFLAHCDICQTLFLCKIISLLNIFPYSLFLSLRLKDLYMEAMSKRDERVFFHFSLKGQKSYQGKNSSSSLSPHQISPV